MRIYYWVGLTVTQPFNTGIQRVTRCLAASLQKRGIDIIPVKWDGGAIAPISQEEADHLAKWGGPQLRPPETLPKDLRGEWLFIPEITHPVVPDGSNVARLGNSLGMNVAAIFYDMIPLKTIDLYPTKTIAWLNQYWATFSAADVTLTISETVRPDLIEWLNENDLSYSVIKAVPLAGEMPNIPRQTTPATHSSPFNLLAVGTWEPRKNYLRIMHALKIVRATGLDVRLAIIGRKTPNEYPQLNNEMIMTARNLGSEVVRLYDYLSDEEMDGMYEAAQATIFGSYIEGFGLPVLESIWHGLPCICHNGSALAEIAPGGGTLMVDMEDKLAIAAGIRSLASDQQQFNLLAHEAVARPIKSWDVYAGEVIATLEEGIRASHLMKHDPIGY